MKVNWENTALVARTDTGRLVLSPKEVVYYSEDFTPAITVRESGGTEIYSRSVTGLYNLWTVVYKDEGAADEG